jgi:hypothetical protein
VSQCCISQSDEAPILHEIAEAEIVIADLTGRNPNVFYELGIVQMVKDVEKVILLTQDADSIPFDIRVFRCIVYKQSIQGARELKDRLAAAVKAVAEKVFRFSVSSGGTYKLPQKVMGADHCAFDFEISECFFAVDGAKLLLQVNRYAAGEPPVVTFKGGFGLMVGERRQLSDVEWELGLDRVGKEVATFVLERRRLRSSIPDA